MDSNFSLIEGAIPTSSQQSSFEAVHTYSVPEKLEFHFQRSKQNNYPIYTDYQKGRTQHVTVLRKYTGNVAVMKPFIDEK